MAHYVASKGGVIGLTKAFATGVRQPGHHGQYDPTDDRRTRPWREKLQELATCRASTSWEGWSRPGGPEHPEDIAGACAFLCSEEAGYITGQLIGVNGGMYI